MQQNRGCNQHLKYKVDSMHIMVNWYSTVSPKIFNFVSSLLKNRDMNGRNRAHSASPFDFYF